MPTQRCTAHKHRNLLAHAPEALHEELSADYTDKIYAATVQEIEQRRRAFLRTWRLTCRAVADSLTRGGGTTVRFRPPAAVPMAIGANRQGHRAIERGFLRAGA